MDNNKKYNIHPDFEQWANFHPPLNKPTLFFMQNLMGLTYLGEKSDENIIVEKINIPIESKNIRAIIYTPKNAKSPSPALMYFHGGGFVLPAAPYHYAYARQYAKEIGCKVVFVDYPLAPKNKYPIPLNACFDCYKWLLEHAEALGVNSKKIMLGGDSAGGCLASTLCMKIYDEKLTMPCAQMLIYPAIPSKEETESMKKFTDTPMCNSEDYKKYEKYYFANEEIKQDKYVSVVNQKKLTIFPPTYIEVAEFDCLRDGGLNFAKNLKEANVNVVVHKPKQTIHGYDMVTDSEISKNSMKKRINFLKKLV